MKLGVSSGGEASTGGLRACGFMSIGNGLMGELESLWDDELAACGFGWRASRKVAILTVSGSGARLVCLLVNLLRVMKGLLACAGTWWIDD